MNDNAEVNGDQEGPKEVEKEGEIDDRPVETDNNDGDETVSTQDQEGTSSSKRVSKPPSDSEADVTLSTPKSRKRKKKSDIKKPTGPYSNEAAKRGEVRVCIQPPIEQATAISDVDDGDEDEPEGRPVDLPGRILKQPATISETSGIFDDERDESSIEANTTNQKWTKRNPNLLASKIPKFVPSELNGADQLMIDKAQSALDYYKLFSTESWVEEIIRESKLYASQRGFSDDTLARMTVDNYRCTEALLLWSGFNGPPQLRQIWRVKQEVRAPFIADNVRQKDVESVLKCLHFR